MMQILVIGGSGRTGQLTIEECLSRGHHVTALVRNAKSIPKRENLTIIEGTPLNKADVRKAFDLESAKPEVAIITLASIRATESMFAAQVSPPRLMADSTANVVAVIQELSLHHCKIVVCSAAGVGESWSQLPLLMRLLLGYSNVKFGYDDHNLLESEVKASGVNFVLAKPMRLTENEPLPIRHYAEGKCIGVTANTSRKSVAVFLVDAAEKEDWDRSTPVFSN